MSKEEFNLSEKGANEIVKIGVSEIIDIIEGIKAYEVVDDLRFKHRRARDFKEELIKEIKLKVPNIIGKMCYKVFEKGKLAGDKLK